MVTCNLAKVDMRVRFSLPAPLRCIMKKIDLHFYPTLVRKIENFITDDEIKSIIDNSKNMEFSKHASIAGDANSSHSYSVDKDNSDTTKILKQLITNDLVIDRLNLVIDEYRQEYGMLQLRIANCWVNNQGIGSQLKFHTHPESIISGALFLNVDEKSSSLHFLNPNQYADYTLYFTDPEKLTYLNYRSMYVQPKNGDLFLFPSWFKHGSNDINQTEERIVLSFNTYYENL